MRAASLKICYIRGQT